MTEMEDEAKAHSEQEQEHVGALTKKLRDQQRKAEFQKAQSMAGLGPLDVLCPGGTEFPRVPVGPAYCD